MVFLHWISGWVLIRMLDFIGVIFILLAMFGDEPGFSQPRLLRGFRKRWTDKSAASDSQAESPSRVPDGPLGEYNFVEDIEDGGCIADDELGSWTHIPDVDFDDVPDHYEPESPIESVHGGVHGPLVTGASGVEYAWQ